MNSFKIIAVGFLFSANSWIRSGWWPFSGDVPAWWDPNGSCCRGICPGSTWSKSGAKPWERQPLRAGRLIRDLFLCQKKVSGQGLVTLWTKMVLELLGICCFSMRSCQDSAFYPAQVPRMLEGCEAWRTLLSLLEDEPHVEISAAWGFKREIWIDMIGPSISNQGILYG